MCGACEVLLAGPSTVHSAGGGMGEGGSHSHDGSCPIKERSFLVSPSLGIPQYTLLSSEACVSPFLFNYKSSLSGLICFSFAFRRVDLEKPIAVWKK